MNNVVQFDPAPSPVTEFLQLIERASRDPTIDLDKMDRLLVMREREFARIAEQSFNASMARVQAAMEPVRADSANPQTRSVYASYAVLDRYLRPTYTGEGFGLTFNTEETPRELEIRVTCAVTHADGHTKNYAVTMPVDGKGARGGDVMTRTHAMGSGITYGKRYLLGMIFNISVYRDDDGNAAAGYTNTTTPTAQELINPIAKEEEARMAAERGREVFLTFCRTRLSKTEYARMRPYLESLKAVVEQAEADMEKAENDQREQPNQSNPEGS